MRKNKMKCHGVYIQAANLLKNSTGAAKRPGSLNQGKSLEMVGGRPFKEKYWFGGK